MSLQAHRSSVSFPTSALMLSAMTSVLHVFALSGAALMPGRIAQGPLPLVRIRCARPRAVSLPGFGSGAGGSSGPSEETLDKYRMLGLPEDATYDEINTAYDELAAKYEGDTKMTIKLQVAKDKILDDRLRQRMRGSLKGAVAESPFDRPEEKQPLIKIPVFLADVMELPTKEYLLKNAGVFGAIGMLAVLSASWAPTSVGLGFAVGLYLLYNRGVPPSNNDMDAEMRPPKVTTTPVALPQAGHLWSGHY